MDEVTITIIGAGIVGLAIAAELAQTYENIVVVEKQDSFGRETSSRNSEVIHAGIYYPPGSLKANLCVAGAEQLYRLCDCQAIPYKKMGKLIVASNQSELPTLEAFIETGKRNNVKNLIMLSKRDVMAKEPRVIAEAALYSPDTGIVDSHAVMKYFHNSAEAHGVLFSFNSEVNKLTKEHDGYVIGIKQDNYEFKSRIVINCAGLSSDSIAELAGIDVQKHGYTLKYCKGSYFSYAKPSPVSMLVYPVPHGALVGLGVHATLDLGGRLRFGPDAEYIDRVLDYKVAANKKDVFYEGARKIIAGLEREAFIPDMSGIRPKLQGPGENVRDFIIREESDKGLPGLINLIGIESPGLTAAPAIATMVAGMVAELMA
jgi:L-2-hydroxyglutarate oxidase LhgO